MTILILAAADDEHAWHVQRGLQQRARSVERLDSRDFPARCTLSFDPQRGAGLLRLPGGRTLDWQELSAVYWRTYHGIEGPELPDARQSYLAANDARGLFESWLVQLPARWVNSFAAWQLHQTKPVQLALAAGLNVPIPATLISNDPGAIGDFAARHPRCIFKPVQGGAHTRRLTADHLAPARLDNLRYAPISLQEEVVGVDVRVFVAGQRVSACEIRTAAVDFRDDPQPQIVPLDVPDELRRQSLAVARAFGLLWTGIDWRRTPPGRYVFLEANPSPMFLGFEHATGLPLTEHLLDLLTDPTTRPG